MMSTEEAAARLGIKPATLYAYVSRGLIRRHRGPDGRSLYSIDELSRAMSRSRARRREITEVPIESAITAIEGNSIYYRGRSVFKLAAERSFEETSHWLWTGTFPDAVPWPSDDTAVAVAAGAQRCLPHDALPLDRLRVSVATLATADPLRYDTRPQGVVLTGRRLIAAMVDSLPSLQVPPSTTIAGRLWSRLTPEPPPEGALKFFDGALVLIADHDMSLSTLAARMAASISADPYSVVSVGLSAAGGAMQSVASLAAEAMLAEVVEPEQAPWAIGERLRRGDLLPGFGHRLYPSGDPRAAFLLREMERIFAGKSRLAVLEAIIATTTSRGIPPPNGDFALAALTYLAGMRRGASEAVFGVARTTSWLAHAIEEYEASTSILPRAIYVGTPIATER